MGWIDGPGGRCNPDNCALLSCFCSSPGQAVIQLGAISAMDYRNQLRGEFQVRNDGLGYRLIPQWAVSLGNNMNSGIYQSRHRRKGLGHRKNLAAAPRQWRDVQCDMKLNDTHLTQILTQIGTEVTQKGSKTDQNSHFFRRRTGYSCEARCYYDI
jgi:hypothetical protein